MLELAARAVQILIALGGAYLLALWFVLIVWTYRDIEARSNSVFTQVFSTLLVVLFFLPGVLLYLLLRPKETLDEAFQRSLEEEYLLQDLEELVRCPSCHRAIGSEFLICPACQARLREPCAGCGKLVDLKWPVCPYCTLPRTERAAVAARVEPPAPRYIAPGVRPRRTGEGAVAGERPAAAAERTDSLGSRVRSSVSALPPMVRPLDRFRAREASPAAGDAGDELVRSLEARDRVAPLSPPAAGGSSPVAAGAVPPIGHQEVLS